MAQVSFSSNSNTEEERKEKCIEKLADITDEVDEKVHKLSAAKQGDEQFLQICAQLREYQDRYNKRDTECTDSVFLGLYANIKSSIGNALKKCTVYQESLNKLVPGEKEPEKKETLAEDQLRKDGTKEKTQHAKGDQVMSERNVGSNGVEHLDNNKLQILDQDNGHGERTPDGNKDSELSQTAKPTNSLGTPNPIATPNQVDSHDSNGAEDTVASGESTEVNSSKGELGDYQKNSSQHSATAGSGPKGEPGAQDLNSVQESTDGPAKTDAQKLSPELGLPQQEDSLTGSDAPVDAELRANVQPHTDESVQPGQSLDQRSQREKSSDSIPIISSPGASDEYVGIGSSTRGTASYSREATPLITANTLMGSTSSGPGPPPDLAQDPVKSVTGPQLAQTPEGESEMTGIKIKKKKRKRQMIQEELDRLMNSPSIFDEKNMYLSYTYLEKPYEEYIYEY
ncbi:PIR Superfamily Protein [Plasmodium ovale wallikeri]|uniref:PIR Superfamily Protein n=1 Tax=Plasmodium ovale wallikeri TaxID=864142 RepID=A0A1A9ANA8_PLAOA|nr:PIR Superfamily Protein [Plasmodium ovale wallikeri]SBT57570.1 PIR Superfamily Protein [Plasmodium ovale wallikeri]